MTTLKRVPDWRTEVQDLPHAQYFLGETRPQNFSHIAFLAFLQPSSHQCREISSQWLHVVIPALKNSNLPELQQAGNRLTSEWTSKKVSRDAFWKQLSAKEEQERANQERIAHLQSAGEKRLQAAENFLVVDSQRHFELETARLREQVNAIKEGHKSSPIVEQNNGDFGQQGQKSQVDSNSEGSDDLERLEDGQTLREEAQPQKKRKVKKNTHSETPPECNVSVDDDEVDGLINSITSISHRECNSWVVDGDQCVGCLIDRYQKDVIQRLRRRELKKTEPADTMILGGTFAPWHPTERMVKIFSHRRLKMIQESLRKDLDKLDINDSCIQQAIRYKMNGDTQLAVQELGTLQDYRLRMLFEQLITNLPRKELEVQAEETLVASNIAPILRTFVNHVDDDIHTHFPSTESSTQKRQGLKADKPDFKVMIGDREVSFGEVTGRCQRSDKAKNGWDLWRLVRFGKSVLDEGAQMVPLVQIIYDEGTLYRHFVQIRGIMVLAEVGVFTVPTHLNSIGSFQASLPVLYWYQGAIRWLEKNREWQKRSWKAADLLDIKKYHC